MATKNTNPKKGNKKTTASPKTAEKKQSEEQGKEKKNKKDDKFKVKFNSNGVEESEFTVNREIKSEIILVITAMFSILLFLSNFSLTGKFGAAVNGAMFGLFGFIAYFVPFILIGFVAFYLANRDSRNFSIVKLIFAILIVILLAAMIQLATGTTTVDTKINQYFDYARQHKNGGGFFGGILCRVLVPFFGVVGSYVVLAALELVCIIVVSGKAIVSFVVEYLKARKNEFVESRNEAKVEKRNEIDKAYDRFLDSDDTDENENYVPDTNKAKTYLLKNAEEKGNKAEENKTKNFFGGFTETVPYGAEAQPEKQKQEIRIHDSNNPKSEPMPCDMYFNQDDPGDKKTEEELIFNGKYTPSEDTVETINDIYEEEMKKKFDGKKTVGVGRTPIKMPLRTEPVKEIITDEEPTEMSFSDTALRDKAYAETAEKTLFDEVPYSRANTKKTETITNKTVEGKDSQLEFVPEKIEKPYVFPPVKLLTQPVKKRGRSNDNELKETAEKLQQTLESFGVKVTVTDVSRGPSVTRYEIQPEIGVKVSRITNLANDIKLNLAASDIRIEAPIPGKAAVGIEVPNSENTTVYLRELIECDEFKDSKATLPFTVGKSIEGDNIIGDIAKMPHLLIAGATGSGKSVCINTLIMSILYKMKPEDVKLIMIDPKVVELSIYNGIPHLLIPVVTDPKKAAGALNWACAEMDRRYGLFAELSVRDLKGYNERIEKQAEDGNVSDKFVKLPQMVVIVDELADLMMVATNEVEDAICRLAQKARACGIHLIIATQRPSVNVITGLIKANIPSRIAFAVSSGVDSRTILDTVGAEKLLGKGDMLYYPTGFPKPVRIQGAFVSDKEVNDVVDFLKKENEEVSYSNDISAKISASVAESKADSAFGDSGNSGRDEYFEEAGKLIISKEKASIGMLQRNFKIGFNRAARIMDQLSEAKVVSEEDGTKPRNILMTMEQFNKLTGE